MIGARISGATGRIIRAIRTLPIILVSVAIVAIPVAAEKKPEAVPIAGFDINLREKPSLDSRVIGRLSFGHEVRVLDSSAQEVEIDGKRGRWTLVERLYCGNEGDACRGWLFDHYLAYRHRLKRVASWPHREFDNFLGGDAHRYYAFTPDGGFVESLHLGSTRQETDTSAVKQCNSFKGSLEKEKSRDVSEPGMVYYVCKRKGHLYRYLNLVCPEGGACFMVMPDGRLISVGAYLKQ